MSSSGSDTMSISSGSSPVQPSKPHENVAHTTTMSQSSGSDTMSISSGPSPPVSPTKPPAPKAPAPKPAPKKPAPKDPEPSKPPKRLVIAIAGPTSSGKTTLSKLLLHVFGNGGAAPGSGFTSVVLHQDDYLVPNSLPAGPRAEWVECFLEEWMGDRLVSRTCMRKGFTVEEADRITPRDEERLISEFRAVNPRRYDAPGFNRHVLYLTLRNGKHRDTRMVTDTFTLDIAIARAKANMLSSDLLPDKRKGIKNYRFLLTKSRLDGPEIKKEEPRAPNAPVKEEFIEKDEFNLKNVSVKKGELTILERLALGITRPYLTDPTMRPPRLRIRRRGGRGYIKNPIAPGSIPPHHCFTHTPHSVQYPQFPNDTYKLIPFTGQLRARVQHWIEEMTRMNNQVGFPGLNVTEGKFRGILFVEGFSILEPAEIDPAAEPRDYDLSLFLSATCEGTRKRRFLRPEYQKPIMKGYMTWREESYFDGIAWPAFVAEHQWLFDITDEEAKKGLIPDVNFENVSRLAQDRGIKVRLGELDIQQTLFWAVTTIMDEFGIKEKNARQKWVDDKKEVARCKELYKEKLREHLMDGMYLMDENDMYLMDQNDIEVMFDVERIIEEMTDMANFEGCQDAEGENTGLLSSGYEDFEDEGDGEGDDADPWLGMRMHGDLVDEDDNVVKDESEYESDGITDAQMARAFWASDLD